MKAQTLYDFIDGEFASVPSDSSIAECLQMLDKEQQKCIAVLKEDSYLGSIHIEDLTGLDLQTRLSSIQYLFRNCAVDLTKTSIDFLRFFAEQETDQLIIMDENRSSVGSISLNDFFAFLRETPFLSFSGEEIVVQKKRVDFTYAEVAQLIEANNARLLGIYTQYVDADVIQLNIRIDHNGINEILQNLRRYDYEIISFHKEDQFNEKLKEHADYFEKFLNI